MGIQRYDGKKQRLVPDAAGGTSVLTIRSRYQTYDW